MKENGLETVRDPQSLYKPKEKKGRKSGTIAQQLLRAVRLQIRRVHHEDRVFDLEPIVTRRKAPPSAYAIGQRNFEEPINLPIPHDGR